MKMGPPSLVVAQFGEEHSTHRFHSTLPFAGMELQ